MSLPCFIPVTGELELHNCPWRLTEQRGRRFYATEKLDGFSMSAGWVNGTFWLTARERPAGVDSPHAAYAVEFELARRLRRFDGLLFQGELAGPGIRGNRLGLSIMEFRVFNVLNGRFIDWPDVQAACSDAEFETVPLLGEFTLDGTVDQLLSYATRASVFGGDKEGAVFRPVAESKDAAGRVSFKVFNPAYCFPSLPSRFKVVTVSSCPCGIGVAIGAAAEIQGEGEPKKGRGCGSAEICGTNRHARRTGQGCGRFFVSEALAR